MHPIGQNILLICPHVEIDFVQPPRFLNSEHSETVKLDHFLPFQTVNVPVIGKSISSLFGRYPYCNGCLLHFISTCRFKKYQKTDDLARVVSNLRITQFSSDDFRQRVSTFYINTVEKAYGKFGRFGNRQT